MVGGWGYKLPTATLLLLLVVFFLFFFLWLAVGVISYPNILFVTLV